MKKYWIKDLKENQVIHAPTKETARKLCNKFHELGLKWATGRTYLEELNWDVYKGETCYSPSDGYFSSICLYTDPEILTIEQLLDFQTNDYPKVMEVSDDGLEWKKRVVFMQKNGKFLAWTKAETIEEAERENATFVWNYARETQPAILELTLDEIAKKFNVAPEQIKIKE